MYIKINYIQNVKEITQMFSESFQLDISFYCGSEIKMWNVKNCQCKNLKSTKSFYTHKKKHSWVLLLKAFLQQHTLSYISQTGQWQTNEDFEKRAYLAKHMPNFMPRHACVTKSLHSRCTKGSRQCNLKEWEILQNTALRETHHYW